MIKLIISLIGLNIVMLPYYIFVFTLGAIGLSKIGTMWWGIFPATGVVLMTFLVMSIPSMLALFFLKQKRAKRVTLVFYVERVIHFAIVVGCYVAMFLTNK